MNARQKRLFEEARKRNPDLKMPENLAPVSDWSEEDLALIKQGVGEKGSRPASASAAESSAGSGEQGGEQTGSVVTYFEAKGFGFLRPDDGGRDIFFHISRVVDATAPDLRPGTKVLYELGMDRTGKVAARSVRLAPQE